MNQGKICVSICSELAQDALEQIRRAQDFADVIEIRFDCLRPSEIEPLLDGLTRVNSQLLLTFRPQAQGGMRDVSLAERIKFWEHALWKLGSCDFIVDYEFDLDLPLDLDPARTIISLHDFEGSGGDLRAKFDAIANLTGKTIKIAVSANSVTDSIEIWKLLRYAESTGKDLIPIAMGEAGKWTRILGLAYGSPITYASPDNGRATAPGQITASDLRDVFRVKELDHETRIVGIVAGDTSYTLSPIMHNAGFKEAGLNFVFVPLQVNDLDAFMKRMVTRSTCEVDLNFAGFSVTNPHKQAIIEHLYDVDETARAIGAVNTVKIDGDRLTGYNTDAPGFIKPLIERFGDLRDSRVAVVGAGGAARAVVHSLKQEGANVTVLARDAAKASRFAQEFHVAFDQLTTDHRPLTTDILVNATPLGTKGEQENDTIATAEQLRGVRLVYDLPYNPPETRLLREAKIAGAETLNGLDMLIAQGEMQFEIWTGKEAPVGVMREAVEKRLR